MPSPESRVSINGVTVGGARIINAGDVLTIAGSQLLVEEATPPRSRCAASISWATTRCRPWATASRVLAPSAEDLPIDLGEVPDIEGFVRAARAHGRSAAAGTTPPGSWAACWRVVLGLFALLEPIALDLRPGDADVKSVGSFSWQSASSVFVFPGEHRLRAAARGLPARPKCRSRSAGPRRRTRSSTWSNYPACSKWTPAASRREISADGAPLGRVPGAVDVPAGDRTLTFKAPRHLDHVERLTIAGGGEKQQLKVALKPFFGVVSISSVPAGAQIEVDGKPAGVTPAKVEMDAGIRRVQVSSPGLRLVDLERRGERRRRRRPSAPSSSARQTRESPCARCHRARR